MNTCSSNGCYADATWWLASGPRYADLRVRIAGIWESDTYCDILIQFPVLISNCGEVWGK
jgi:hypothetical protein